MFEEHIEVGQPDIAAPHSFDFQLRYYVVAPEMREDDTLVQIFRLRSGRLVKVDVASRGSVEAPLLVFRVKCHERVSNSDHAEIRERVSWRLCLDEDLRPFYGLVASDAVLSASIAYNFGAKFKSSYSLFDAVVDCICAQNTRFRRLYVRRANGRYHRDDQGRHTRRREEFADGGQRW